MRWVVALLIAANVAFWSWSRGWLDGVLPAASSSQSEPQRLAEQVKPERMRILSPAEAAGLAARPRATAESPLGCLQIGPYAGGQLAAAESALRTAVPELPAERVVRSPAEVPGQWLIYMGRFEGPEALQEKRQELRRRNVTFEEMFDRADLVPGLVLGRFNTRAEAEAERARLQEQHNVQTARVISLAGDGTPTSQWLRVERIDGAMQVRLNALAEPALAGRSFEPCASRG
jgi:hypothetical protein